MPRDIDRSVVPKSPDWGWLCKAYPDGGLLRLNQSVADVGRLAGGRVAYLAAPYIEFSGGRALAADCALEWKCILNDLGLTVHAPTVESWEAECRGGRIPDWRAMLRVSDLVVVPPLEGCKASVDVWQAVNAALLANMPVHVIGLGAGNG